MFCCIYDTSEHNANARAFQWTWQTMIVYKKRTDTNTHHTVHMKRGAIKTKKSCTRHGDTFGKRKSGHAKRRVACTFCSWDVCGSSSFYVVFVPLLSSFLLFFFFSLEQEWDNSENSARWLRVEWPIRFHPSVQLPLRKISIFSMRQVDLFNLTMNIFKINQSKAARACDSSTRNVHICYRLSDTHTHNWLKYWTSQLQIHAAGWQFVLVADLRQHAYRGPPFNSQFSSRSTRNAYYACIYTHNVCMSSNNDPMHSSIHRSRSRSIDPTVWQLEMNILILNYNSLYYEHIYSMLYICTMSRSLLVNSIIPNVNDASSFHRNVIVWTDIIRKWMISSM